MTKAIPCVNVRLTHLRFLVLEKRKAIENAMGTLRVPFVKEKTC